MLRSLLCIPPFVELLDTYVLDGVVQEIPDKSALVKALHVATRTV